VSDAADRWERVQALFHDVVDLPAEALAARLDAERAHDPDLVAAVERLVEGDGLATPILEMNVAGIADAVLTARAPGDVRFAPYELEELVGEGGMGVVYRAVRVDLGGEVAIKVLRDAGLSPARQRRFRAEQRLLARLSHPSIAALHHADVLPDGTPWFAMEYVEGLSITEHCFSHALDLRERIELFRSVLEAVQYLHGHAVIHRDLKPSNLLVTKDGAVKLLDFGIAKSLDETDPELDATQTGLHMMTPSYAAPEQLRGQPIGVHTDVYALGLVLYELLTGALPWARSGATPAEVAERMSDRPAERPSARARTGSGPRASAADWRDFDVLCLKALSPEPGQRYRTVDALLRDVDHWLGGEPLDARSEGLGYRIGKFVRRNRTSVLAAAVAALTLVGLVGYYTARLSTARIAAEREAERTLRIQGFVLDLFEGGDATAGPADSIRVVELLERGVLEADALDSEPAVQAELYRTLGGVYQKLGGFDRADDVLARARAAEARAGLGPVDVAATLVAVAQLRVDQARLDEAETEARAAIAILDAVPSAPAAASASAWLALGQALEAKGDYEGAIAAAQRVSDRDPDELADEVRLAGLGQLADAHYYAGHYDAADSLNTILLGGARRLHGDEHPRVADILINLGASQVDRGRYAEADPFYREAIGILEDFHGADHFRTASALTMLGRALVYQAQFDEGVPLLERALAVQERVNGPVHPRVASALNDLGSAALQRGHLDVAEARFRRMASIYERVYAEEHYLVGIATSNLASVLFAKGEHAEAERLFRDAIGVYERTQGAEHLNTGIGRIKLGRTLLRLARAEEAAAELLAGYDIVRAQASPSVSWLQSARTDLVTAYEALGRTEDAARFRAELEEVAGAGA
jgi:serine/threonine-protein kinase